MGATTDIKEYEVYTSWKLLLHLMGSMGVMGSGVPKNTQTHHF